ncbi:hypothetical protein [Labilithrix luteola]|nr:hypothetical protein [Labilithrix luteola]
MNHSRVRLLGALVVPQVVLAISCAAAEESAQAPAPSDTVIADASSEASDAGTTSDTATPDDASCDGGCTATCDDGAFCVVIGAVDPRYALTSIWGSSANDVWAAGAMGTIVHWDGSAWTSTPSGTSETFMAIYGTGSNDVYALGHVSYVRHSDGFSNGTATWTPRVGGERYRGWSRRARAAWGTSPADVIIGGDFIYDYDYDEGVMHGMWNLWRREDVDGGIDWVGVEPTASQSTVRGLWGTSSTDLWALIDRAPYGVWGPGGEGGGSLHLTSNPGGGAPTWIEVNTKLNTGLKGIHGTGKDDVWAVGAGGAIRHFGPGQHSWTIVDSPVTEDLNAVWAVAPDDAWIVGDRGTVLHYDGKVWTRAPVLWPRGEIPSLYGVWGSGPHDVWTVGEGVVLHYEGKKDR